MRLLGACRDANVRVIGVEGFDVAVGQRRPDIAAILDLGNVDKAADSVEKLSGSLAR